MIPVIKPLSDARSCVAGDRINRIQLSGLSRFWILNQNGFTLQSGRVGDASE